MSTATTQSLRQRRVRYVRDLSNLIVEIREFDHNAKLGNVCYSLRIKRDVSTKKIIGFHTQRSKVNQDDLDLVT